MYISEQPTLNGYLTLKTCEFAVKTLDPTWIYYILDEVTK